MNVAQLKEALEEFGDHLEVVVVVDKGADSVTLSNLTVDYSTTATASSEPMVTIEVTL